MLTLLAGSAELKKLHDRFKALVKEREVPVLSFGEGEKTVLPYLPGIRATIVPKESSGM